MDEFANLVPKGYGLKPQGKLAPMSATKGSSSAESVKGSSSSSNSGRSGNRGDDFFFTSTRNASSGGGGSGGGGGGGYEDVFGGPPKFAPPPSSNSYDEIFRSQPPPAPPPPSKDHSLPVFDDAPPSSYGDDIFLGVRGTRPGVAYDSVFAGPSSSGHPPADLLGGFQTNHVRKPSSSSSFEPRPTYDDDEGLIPGMGSSTYTSKPAAERSAFISVDDDAPAEPAEVDPFGDIQPDPFSGMPVPDPLDSFAAKSSNDAGDGFEGFDIFSQVKTEGRKSAESVPVAKPVAESESDSDEASSPRKNKAQAVHEAYIPGSSFGTSAGYSDRGFTESWVTVDDVKLVTQPTMAPPPSRAPPGVSGYDISGPGRQYSNSFEDESTEPEAYNERPAEFEEHGVSNEEEIRINKERMELEERERERLRKEKERQVVDRVNRETRERSAKQARERAAERAAVERALHESRLRAVADAKQRAEEASRQAEVARQAQKAEEAAKLKAEEAAKQKAEEELKQKDAERRAQRTAVERVTAAARERYEKVAVQRLKEQQQQQQQQKQQQQQQQHHRSSDDLDNIFHVRPNSAPRQRPQDIPDERPAPSSVKKVSSVSGIDSLSDFFDNNGSGVEGETTERRKARLDRDQRTQARARQALEEKHRRDVAVQREQAEKQRVSETVDAEIKRWAAGKEGNIRALLSSLQYVLWPECGWQPVSLTDLITGASVKKVYRKATLFVHPDKVQQKGATVQQKYIAEKVFDLLKEAWNKFNSEELF